LKKILLVFSLILILILGCNSNVIEPYNYEKDTPEWLKEKINSIAISNMPYYHMAEVNRYKWNNDFIFQFDIPVSSCLLCEVYYYNGTKVNFANDSTVQNYLLKRTNKLLI
jgi:hypothetical protein